MNGEVKEMSLGITGNRDMLIMKKAMDAASLRQEVIANNIANVNTAGYKAQKVSFEEAMKAAAGLDGGISMEKTREGHLGSGSAIESIEPEVERDASASQRMDGNNVDIESEMVNLAANQLLYSALTQQVSNKISVLRYVIHEGRR